MPKHPLYIVTYDRGNHPVNNKVNPYHWAYFIQVNIDGQRRLGVTHQLHGMPGNFYYQGPEDADLGPIKEELVLGEIDSSDMAKVHDILRGVKIDQTEHSGWNCQSWTLEGLEGLRESGFIYEHLGQEEVKHWLKEH